MVKIIFLDIDGVLNSEEFHKSEIGDHIRMVAHANYINKESQGNVLSDKDIYIDHIDPRAVKHLQEIIDKTDAKIVLSSTWRKGRTYTALLEILKELNFTGKIIDVTGTGCNECYRGNEIYTWIKNNEKLLGYNYSDYKNYVIIDGDGDMLWWQRNNFIKTSWKTGLERKHIVQSIKILNQGD